MEARSLEDRGALAMNGGSQETYWLLRDKRGRRHGVVGGFVGMNLVQMLCYGIVLQLLSFNSFEAVRPLVGFRLWGLL